MFGPLTVSESTQLTVNGRINRFFHIFSEIQRNQTPLTVNTIVVYLEAFLWAV